MAKKMLTVEITPATTMLRMVLEMVMIVMEMRVMADGGSMRPPPAIPPHPMIDPVAHKLQDLPPVSCESKPSLH